MTTGKATVDAAPTVLDPSSLDAALAAGQPALPLFREARRELDRRLREDFEAGGHARDLVPARAAAIDALMRRAWLRHPELPAAGCALVAVGGYGRGELHPGSDVDLMVLTPDGATGLQGALERLIAFLWDIGLEVGHSVRSVADCVTEAAADITIATNLLEARLLDGPQALFMAMQEATSARHLWPSRTFLESKLAEQRARHAKYHDTAYNLEPNIKEGPGGLRDLQTIVWAARRHFGVGGLRDLVGEGFLTEAEYLELAAARDFLWQVRFALHCMAGRREDRLLFDYQHPIAALFGLDQGHRAEAVERFMQRYYRSIMELSRLNEMLLQFLQEAILYPEASDQPVAINRRFQLRKGFIEAIRPNVFLRYPFALLELFLLLQQHPEIKGVRASTVRLIREHRPLIDDRFRNDVRAKSLFMEILRQPNCVTRSLRRMNRYGVLAAYLPEFGRIVGRMQYDLFHAYTVDQHTLFAVRNVRRFCIERFNHEFPHCSAVAQRLPKPELLVVAAIYHDIAKGRQGDHSTLGAVDVAAFGERHGLGRFDVNLLEWLVANHLVMSLTAQKKDLNDPEVINAFARHVGDQTHLDYLYLLTVADIRATNPSLWNSWRESLLRDLYELTLRALRRGLGNPIDKEERVAEVRAQALGRLTRTRIDNSRIEAVWNGFHDDYFLRYSPDEIVWHTRAILKKAHDGRALVLVRADAQRGGTEIFIYTRDKDSLFAICTAALTQLGLTILDARIMTSLSGYAVDSFTVLEASGALITERGRMREIATTVRRLLNRPAGDLTLPTRRPPRVLRHFRTPTEVHFDTDPSNQRTVLQIITSDRPGLLCRIGQAFVECGIRVQNAKIVTVGARAEDIFFITDQHNRPLLGEQQHQQLRDAVLRNVGDGSLS